MTYRHRCPKCGNRQLRVEYHVVMDLNGSTGESFFANGCEVSFDSESHTLCAACEHEGSNKEFEVTS